MNVYGMVLFVVLVLTMLKLAVYGAERAVYLVIIREYRRAFYHLFVSVCGPSAVLAIALEWAISTWGTK